MSDYYLVVVRKSGESRMRRARKWLIGVPVLCGLIFTLASIPFIVPSFRGCQVVAASYRFHESTAKTIGLSSSPGPWIGLSIFPPFIVILYSTVAILRVYWHVRATQTNVHDSNASYFKRDYSNDWRTWWSIWSWWCCRCQT